MVDNTKSLVSALNTVLKTYLEESVDNISVVPCITYFLYNDSQERDGDTLGYSNVTFCIKVWDHSISSLIDNSIKVDEVLRDLGYKRISSNETSMNNLVCNVMLYKGLSKENYKGD